MPAWIVLDREHRERDHGACIGAQSCAGLLKLRGIAPVADALHQVQHLRLGKRIVGLDRERALVGGNSLIERADLLQCRAEIVVRLGKIRLEADRFAKARLGLRDLA